MRHQNKGRSLSRSPSHRKALLDNLAQELFQHKRIQTTLAKARELRPFAEKLVTTAKKNHLAARRDVLKHLSRKAVVKTLFDEIAPSFAERNGGYTRIVKLIPRIGDNAKMAVIELVGFEGVLKAKAEAEKAKAAKKTSKGARTVDTKRKPSKKDVGEAKTRAKTKAAKSESARTRKAMPSTHAAPKKGGEK
jgi:large subunit ribosomal protein L17